jgi:hypothetical protein
MKNTLLLILTNFALLSFVFSQSEEKEKSKNRWGCTIAVNSVEAQIGDPEKSSWGIQSISSDKSNNSYSISFIPKIFLKPNFILRFELGYTNIRFVMKQENVDNINKSKTIISLSQKFYKVNPGIQWNYFNKLFFNSYCGAMVQYSKYSDVKIIENDEIREITTDSLSFWAHSERNHLGGYSFGIGIFNGINIMIQKHISIGAEISYSLLYYNTGGKFTTSTIYQSVPNPPITAPEIISSHSYMGLQFSKITPTFNISLFF